MTDIITDRDVLVLKVVDTRKASKLSLYKFLWQSCIWYEDDRDNGTKENIDCNNDKIDFR